MLGDVTHRLWLNVERTTPRGHPVATGIPLAHVPVQGVGPKTMRDTETFGDEPTTFESGVSDRLPSGQTRPCILDGTVLPRAYGMESVCKQDGLD
jgi:hypothetical protein